MKRVMPLLALSLTACVQTNVAPLNPTMKLEPTCIAAVQMFTSPDRVVGEYTEIALLNSSGSSSATNEQQMIESMRQKAAEAGANGIILSNIAEPSAGAKVAGAIFGTGAERKGRSLAIRVPSDTARMRDACVRSFLDSSGTMWTVSEFQEGRSSRLRFNAPDRATVYHEDPPDNWRELDVAEMGKLFSRARPRK